MADLTFEKERRRLGFDTIIGVDEAGRGPLAGPVVASAVLLRSYRFKNRIDDSKKLTQKAREQAFLELIQKSVFALSIVDEKIIDRINILEATRNAMVSAILSLLSKVDSRRACVLVDGNMGLCIPGVEVTYIIRGDSLCLSIAAASIIAKVARDSIMCLYDRVWPQYGFSQHKGYPTLIHRRLLKQYGVSPIHRLSFSHAS